MLKQQVNLLNSLPKPKRAYISFARLKVFLMAAILLLIVTYSAFYFQGISVAKDLKQLTNKRNNLTTKISDINKRRESAPVDEALQEKVSVLVDMLSSKQQILDTISPRSALEYADLLTILSEKTPDGMWLELIQVDPEDDLIKFTGKAVSADLVPKFISNLKSTTLLASENFNSVHVARTSDMYVNFTVQTKHERGDEEEEN